MNFESKQQVLLEGSDTVSGKRKYVFHSFCNPVEMTKSLIVLRKVFSFFLISEHVSVEWMCFKCHNLEGATKFI